MRNVFRILKRDVIRLLKAPAALIVVIALIAIPSLYTWVNVYGFWDPYGNTGKMRVCFASEDIGASSELTGYMNIGDMIDAKLRENTQLGWAFMSKDEALEEVRSGTAYAAFIVGSDFSKKIMSLMTTEFEKPTVEYYVNEKVSAVSPKVTDSGSTTLDETINSTFVSTVGEKVVDVLNDALAQTGSKADEAQANAAGKVAEARNIIANSKDSLAELDAGTQDLQGRLASSREKLGDVKPGIEGMKEKLSATGENAQQAMDALNALLEKALPALNNSSSSISDAVMQASTAMSELSAGVQSARADASAVIEQQKLSIAQNKAALEQLDALTAALPNGVAKDQLSQQSAALSEHVTQAEAALAEIEAAGESVAQKAQDVSDLTSQMSTALQNATSAATLLNTSLYQTVVPQVDKSVRGAEVAIQAFSDAGDALSALVDQMDSCIVQIGSSLEAARSSIQATNDSIGIFDEDLVSLQGDLDAVTASAVIGKLLDGTTLDAKTVGDFLGAPTKVQTESLYTLNAYGSAMAPLFMNLTFWIGAFMLLVILRQEVDSEGVKDLTIAQRYIARWLLLSCFAVLQALLCVAGVLVLGVQTVNVAALCLISVLCSITYLSIMFMLSTTLQHIGKGLCVLLAFLQIPGATGLYPIEMTVPFFQQIYPFFPFTYGINGLRETICGFYGNEFLICIAALMGFLVSSMLVGIYLRPFLTNFNKLFAKQIREGGIFAGEEIEIPTQRFRLAQLVGYISGREEYKAGLEKRAKRFMGRYVKFKRYALGLGVVASVVIAVFFSRMPVAYKPSLLSAWLGVLILTALVVVFIEHTYDSLERQISLDDLSDEELRGLAASRDKVGKTTSELFEKQRDGKGRAYVDYLAQKKGKFNGEKDKAAKDKKKNKGKKTGKGGERAEAHEDGKSGKPAEAGGAGKGGGDGKDAKTGKSDKGRKTTAGKKRKDGK